MFKAHNYMCINFYAIKCKCRGNIIGPIAEKLGFLHSEGFMIQVNLKPSPERCHFRDRSNRNWEAIVGPMFAKDPEK